MSSLVVIGLSHHSSPVELRERFAIAEARVPDLLQRLRDKGIAEGGVILSTCNRVELYVATTLDPAMATAELKDFFLSSHNYHEPIANEIYALAEPQSLEHLFRVACGLDSMVLGETEILGQLKQAYEISLTRRHSAGRLNKIFQRAFNVAKQVRTETSIQRGSVSVGSVAVELAQKIFSSLADRQVMVIGAGDTSEKTARALLSRGARSIIVANRTYERAQELARELGGRAVHFESWSQEFAQVDIAISSTAAPHHILDRTKLEPLMKLRKHRPLLLIDIAVPRDIDPEVNLMPDVYLYNIDDLQSIADDSLKQRKEEIVRCEKIIRQRMAEFLPGDAPPPFGDSRPAFGHD